MNVKKTLCALLACAALISCFCLPAGAVEVTDQETITFATRASGQFNMSIKANTIVKANTSFPLEAGEVVTIKASYSPFSASVDFGLIAPDGMFYSVNVRDGSVNQRIEVDQRGSYTLAIRNNSSRTISVSGYVNY